jgi:diaminopimelate epimerase
MPIRFAKMHGLGNDFVVVDRRREGMPVPSAVAVRLCDRRFGVGADGVLSVLTSPDAPTAMHVTNADGSVAEMCGNGLRCVALWSVREGLLPPGGGPVATGRGPLDCRVDGDRVSVSMGRATFEPSRVPVVSSAAEVVDEAFAVDGGTIRLTALSMGNPHAVTFVDGPVDLHAMATHLGPLLEHHPRFPARVNVGFARVTSPRSLDLVVWERGSGLTLACGTGACAAVVAARRVGVVAPTGPVEVRLPGGLLVIDERDDDVVMSGPAAFVFEGVVG